ncbi:hypothetical protein Nepgr_020279 [Nepenthes gracilis]|uniref:Uncharacterized protein n=1 Tax=Nepenthes gracilis TaxID=150966 RepID=A0AAD3SUP7_NEPGR|nr:hypothetical protein Nepgr_020279 [Nepenthes gracilis]
MAKKRESSSFQAPRVSRHGVHNTESVLTAGAIAALVVDYGLSSDWSYRAPGTLDRASPPSGLHHDVRATSEGGLCYPMPYTLYALVDALRNLVARLHPNALRYLVSLCIFAHLHSSSFDAKAARLNFRFTESEDRVSMSLKAGFRFRGTNPDSEKSPAEDAVEAAELISAFKSEESKFSIQGYFLTSITFEASKWGPPSGWKIAGPGKREPGDTATP